MKGWNYLSLLIILLLLLVVVGLFVEILITSPLTTPEDDAFCVVVDSHSQHYLAAKNDTINLDIGKEQFRNLCASCHNKNMRDDLFGPALGGVMERFNQDTLSFASYVRNSEMCIQNVLDLRPPSIVQKPEQTQKFIEEHFTLNEATSIIMYIDLISK